MNKYTIQDFLEVKSSISASISPDSSKLSFLSNLTGTYQLYITSIKGDKTEQITSYNDSLSFAVFLPTEDKILFSKCDGGNEQNQLYIYSLDTREIKELTKNPEVRYDFGGFSFDGKYISYVSTERNGKDKDAYIMNLETEEVQCVYDNGGPCNVMGFSPNGTYLGIKRDNTNLDQDLFLINLKTKEIEHINPHNEAVYFDSVGWKPDESAFFVVTNKDRDFIGLSKYSLVTKNFEYVLTPEWDVESAVVSSDGKYIASIINEDGYWNMSVRDQLDVSKIYNFNLPQEEIYSVKFSKDSKYLALIIGSSVKNSDVWIYSIEENTYWQVTRSPQGVPNDVLVEPKLIRYKSFDNLDIPAFLFLPDIYTADQSRSFLRHYHLSFNILFIMDML